MIIDNIKTRLNDLYQFGVDSNDVELNRVLRQVLNIIDEEVEKEKNNPEKTSQDKKGMLKYT